MTLFMLATASSRLLPVVRTVVSFAVIVTVVYVVDINEEENWA